MTKQLRYEEATAINKFHWFAFQTERLNHSLDTSGGENEYL